MAVLDPTTKLSYTHKIFLDGQTMFIIIKTLVTGSYMNELEHNSRLFGCQVLLFNVPSFYADLSSQSLLRRVKRNKMYPSFYAGVVIHFHREKYII